MSAPIKRTIRGEVPTRDHLPRYADEGDAYIVARENAILVRSFGGGWELVPAEIAAAEIERTRAGWYAALRDDDYDPRPDEIAADFWPYDGPYSQWTTVAAATLIGGLVRYLNNATQKPAGLPNAPTIGQILSGLIAAVYGLDQLLDQLQGYAAGLVEDDSLYDDRVHDDRALAAATAVQLVAELAHTRRLARGLRAPLDQAGALASHLGNRAAGHTRDTTGWTCGCPEPKPVVRRAGGAAGGRGIDVQNNLWGGDQR